MIFMKIGSKEYIAKYKKRPSFEWKVSENRLNHVIFLTGKKYTEEVEDTSPKRKYDLISAVFNTPIPELMEFVKDCL